MINQQPTEYNVPLSSVSCSSKVIKPQGGGCFIPSQLEAQVTTWTHDQQPKSGAVSRDGTLDLWRRAPCLGGV